MTRILQNRAYGVPVDCERVRRAWAGEGFSFGVFRDPPGQAWNDFAHNTDEDVLVAEGEMEITVGTASFEADPGGRIRIPRHIRRSLRTASASGSVWLYGYSERNDD
jgi:mannose-6-phosphate isomerase-like protein (cupin superfamily)